MTSLPDLFGPRFDHSPGCQCLPCLRRAYQDARTKVITCTTVYRAMRERTDQPREMSRTRQQWTTARQELVLAEHALRTAEDGQRAADKRDADVDALAWNPEEDL